MRKGINSHSPKSIISDQNLFYNEIVTCLKWAEVEAINVITAYSKVFVIVGGSFINQAFVMEITDY